MSNKITEKYFKYNNSIDDFNEIIKEILAKTNFQPEREIFRGQIYDSDKVGSLIYQSVWQDKLAVLKIQKRCIGATLLDIQAQNYEYNCNKFVTYLTNLFRELFDYLANRL
ncbi:MAG TPA: hypothetical protein ENL06_01010 [Candidatus Portnoybacteria bacterium]|nr:hypothetical protein [Candidatus Portnoybacteria bacterium]